MSEPDKPRLCRECKHYGGVYTNEQHRCFCPELAPIDLVTGGRDAVDCRQQRQRWSANQIALGVQVSAMRCGPEGLCWEQATGPRPTDNYHRTDWSQAYWKDQGWKGE